MTRVSTARRRRPASHRAMLAAACMVGIAGSGVQGVAAAPRGPAGLGAAAFNTLFVPNGIPGAARHSGLGPLFDAESCDQCHNGAGQSRGPIVTGPAPEGLIIALEEPGGKPGRRPDGDPHYGHVLSTQAVAGVPPEAQVSIRFRARRGRFPDGERYTLHVPRIVLEKLSYGALASHTIIEPRLAPALNGVGLLASVPARAILAPVGSDAGKFSIRWRAGRARIGRLGWQATSVSLRDQTTKALERDMGVTSREYRHDDCTQAETACGAHSGATPEIAGTIVDALIAYERSLSRPVETHATRLPPVNPMFSRLGCAACHSPRLPVSISGARGSAPVAWIAPYTDLRLHDLGAALDDRDAAGRTVATFFRTAPLWNLGDLADGPGKLALLHDGRARSIEEAVLWHGGEAQQARERFVALPRTARRQFLTWLSHLGGRGH